MQWIRSSIKFFVDQTNRVIVLRMAESHVLNVHVFIWASLLSCVLVSSYSQIVDPVTMVTESLNIDIYLDVERMGYINQSFCPAYHTGYQSKFTYVPEPSNSVQDTPTATIEGSSYGTGLSNSATDEGPSLPDKMTGTVEGDKTLSELFDDLYMLATNEDYGKTTELNTMKENTIDNILAYAYKAADKALAADVTEGSDGDVGEELLNKTQGRYVYPKLTRIDPGKV